MEKINRLLLWLSAVAVMCFIIMVEYYNGLTCDDLLFATKLRQTSIFGLISDAYMHWQGRYLAFGVTGIFIKCYLWLGTFFPISLLFFILNICLLTRAIQIYFKTLIIDSIAYAIVLHGLYFLVMLETACYFWVCARGCYVLSLSFITYLLVKLLTQKKGMYYDYIAVIIASIFAGASWETCAPNVLVVMGCVLLYYWIKLHLNIKQLFQEYPLLITSFITATIAFLIMICAPGNFVRASWFASIRETLTIGDYLMSVLKGFGKLIKPIGVACIPYFPIVIVIFASLFVRIDKETITKEKMWNNILLYSLILLGLISLSFLLKTYAVGNVAINRGESHIILMVLFYLAFVVRDVLRFRKPTKNLCLIYTLALVYLLAEFIYMIPTNQVECIAYNEAEQKNMEYIQQLQANHTQGVVELNPLKDAILHSLRNDAVNRVTRMKVPFLYSNIVNSNPNYYFNIYYQTYYQLDFKVKLKSTEQE